MRARSSTAFLSARLFPTLAAALAFLSCDGDALNPVPRDTSPSDAAVEAGDATLEDGGVLPDAPAADASADADATPTALRILFIGNSYTYVNDLPGMLSRIAATSGMLPTITTDQVVQGGARLEDHWNNGVAQGRIADGGFTHVVLQGQSQEAAIPYYSDLFTLYAQHFGDLAVDAGARPTLFVTWARAKGDTLYDAGGYGTFTSPDEMQDKLTYAYANAATRWRTSILACIGEAFRQSLQRYPAIVLHQSDLSHASVSGTYLAASTLYVALTGRAVPDASEVPAGVGVEDAAHLREVAKIGTACAAPRVESSAKLYDLGVDGYTQNVDGPDGGPAFDFGTAGTAVDRIFYLANLGDAGIDVRDASVPAPFAWTSGAFPGGAGTANGSPFCSTSLAPNATCALSVRFTGTASGIEKLALELGNTYQSPVTRTLSGTTTSRALLTVSPHPGVAPPPTRDSAYFDGIYHVQAGSGETRPFTLFVANRGGAAASSLSVGTALAPPFFWGSAGSGAFPGGSGSVDVRGVSYPYCGSTLPVGAVCAMTANFTPTMPLQSFTAAIDVAYEDATGPLPDHAVLPLAGNSGPDAGL